MGSEEKRDAASGQPRPGLRWQNGRDQGRSSSSVQASDSRRQASLFPPCSSLPLRPGSLGKELFLSKDGEAEGMIAVGASVSSCEKAAGKAKRGLEENYRRKGK